MAVMRDGTIWAVDEKQKLWRRVGGEWVFVAKEVVDVAIGPDDSIFTIGGKKVNFGYSIKQYLPESKTWKSFPGNVLQIAVGPEGNPWVISSRRTVLSWNGEGWRNHKVGAS